MTAIALRRLQRWFVAVVAHPASATTALASARAAALVPPRRVASVVAASARMSAAEQLQIYADGWFARLLDVMRGEFPGVERALGAATFHRLVLRYALACPSRHANLNQFGARFPAWLRRQRGARRAFAADVARFERAIAEAFDAPASPALAAGALQQVPSDQWGETRFTMTPSLQLLRCEHPVAAWCGDPTRRTAPRRQRSWIAVWRRDDRVHWRRLAAAEAGVLRALAAGRPLAAALATARGGAPVADWFRAFAAEGLFTALW